MPTTIEVNKQSVEALLGSGKAKPFVIPEYQRPYAWTDEQVETLFEDLWDFTATSGGTEREGSYFLGSIVAYENEDGEQEIIDGQQRITSLFLLLRAIYTKLAATAASERTPEANNFIGKIEPAIWRTNKLTGTVDFKNILLTSRVVNLDEQAAYANESIQQLFYYNMFHLRALEQDTKTTTPGIRKYYAANKFERLYKEDLLDTLFVILNLWKVINKGEEIEDEAWSKNAKIRQSLDTLSSYPNEFWKYPVVIYYVCYRNKADFEQKFGLFLNKLLMELLTKYLLIPTINAVMPDILKLNSAIVSSDTPTFDFKDIDTGQLEARIQNPNRNVVRMLLKLLAYEKQDELLPARWEIEHIFPQKWQTNYFPDVPDAAIKEKIEHIGNKLPFEKKLNIVAGNGYFGKKKKEYAASKIAITKAMGTSETTEWDIDSIMKRDIRISDAVMALLAKWNDDYLNIPTAAAEEEKPSKEDLARIAEFKKKGWI